MKLFISNSSDGWDEVKVSDFNFDDKGGKGVYLLGMSLIFFDEPEKMFIVDGLYEDFFKIKMDAEAFQLYINQCQEFLNKSIKVKTS